MKDKLYLFNFFGMISAYVVVIVLNFVFRTGYINGRGVCVIGMKKFAMIPLISFDVVVNVYLTMLFLVPLRSASVPSSVHLLAASPCAPLTNNRTSGLYSYQNNTNLTLRKMALRTFFGSCATLTSSVVNLTVLMVLNGEPGWICLMCCNADILFSVLVLHWVTSIDATSRSNRNSRSGLALPITSPTSNKHDIEAVRRDSHRMSTKIVGDDVCEPPQQNVPVSAITVMTEQTWEVGLDGTSNAIIVTREGDIKPLPLRNSSTDAAMDE